jgi:Flp pilus assembly protein TadG
VSLSRLASRPYVRRSRGRQRGQGMVEFAIIVPVFLLLLMGMLEFGFVFTHNLSLEYATREGARAGATLSNGGTGALPAECNAIDPAIINAVTKVLKSPGSPIVSYPNAVATIKIWQSDLNGNPLGASTTNTWTNKNDGSFTFTQGTVNWAACSRHAVTWLCGGVNPACLSYCSGSICPPDSIGVSLSYTYTMITPLGAIEKFFGPAGPATLPMTDKTVMSLNPTN